jgi:hypothetical protein
VILKSKENLDDWGDSAFDPVGHFEAKWHGFIEGQLYGRGNFSGYNNERVNGLNGMGEVTRRGSEHLRSVRTPIPTAERRKSAIGLPGGETMSERKLVGTVSHYFSKVRVAGVLVSDRLAVGDQILIIGHTTALEQTVASLELDRQPIEVAEAGQEVGIRVIDRVRQGDQVYKLTE